MAQMRTLALLRGINVGGNHQVPMTALRSLCESLGWKDVKTYIQSGNVVFSDSGPPAKLEKALEVAIQTKFGFEISVLVRSAASWADLLKANPFPKVPQAESKFVMVAVAKQVLAHNAASALQARAVAEERIVQIGEVLWIHSPSGVGKSKLTPALMDRLAGSRVTLRNLRTVAALANLLNA